MAEFTLDQTVWSDTDKVWEVSLQQLVTATANLGIPSNPYVYKVFIEKSLFDSYKAVFINGTDETKKDKIQEILYEKSTFVRPTQSSDLSLDTLSSLSHRVSELLDEDFYGFQYSKEEVDPSNPASNTVSTPNISSDLPEFSGQQFVLRKLETEHIPLSGWVYFKHTDLLSTHRDHPSAKKIRDSSEHYITWHTKTESNENYKPLTAGVISVNPIREFSPGSSIVSGLVAGDTVRVQVSGGSGEYTISASGPNSSNIEKTSNSSWRIISNSTASILLSIQDDSITEASASITLNVVEQV
jgi:hypothetical protein